LEFDLRVAVLAEHALEGDVGEDLLPADGTPEELNRQAVIWSEVVLKESTYSARNVSN